MNINQLWFSINENDWKNALEVYWYYVKEDNVILEKNIENIDAVKIRDLKVEEFYDFLYNKYYAWRYTAKNRLKTTRMQLERYHTENRMSELKQIHKDLFSFDLNDIETGIMIAKRILGLNTGASGLLSILFPTHFASYDSFSVVALSTIENLPEKSLIRNMNMNSLKIRDGTLLIKIMKNKAFQLNLQFNTDYWTPRKIDKILWAINRI